MKHDKPFFSIIFPIYNREIYLQETLQSILSQSFGDFELIAIDDGSTDQSLAILQSLQDQRIKVFTQSNLGVSEARNTGIKHAKGEYLCFADSDDILHPNYLQDFYTLIQKTQASLIKNNSIIKFHSSPKFRPHYQLKHIHIVSLNTKNIKIGGTIWSYCIKTSLVKDIHLLFLPQRIMEDEIFIFMLLPFVDHLVLFRGSPYLYRQHSNSIVSTHPVAFDRINNFHDLILWYQHHKFLDSFPIPFYILYDISLKNPNYLTYISRSKEMLQTLNLSPSLLSQDPLIPHLLKEEAKAFQEYHAKSRGKIKFYLRKFLCRFF
ncbi:glycosyltransferase family 2 protein [Helicobacter sp. faydin-H17]|uniref:glycosyltransferase family 2 protein n=1 Tax=Helicobacter kayseriensis TaxID=2905877 RepID=UPI001E5D1C36|nr:glycosyltransferase family A protein [Helicobacter kayseriensis]MCE3047674.1 glycosyltransferase family 2 protein [Helicobacter kayseriensis]